jgi:1-deoxy-D-xylulose-5-phosphate reductoisomerase
MNAANEIAVAAFLDRKVRFPEIWEIVEDVMNQHPPVAQADLDAILGADQWARAQAQGCVESAKG